MFKANLSNGYGCNLHLFNICLVWFLKKNILNEIISDKAKIIFGNVWPLYLQKKKKETVCQKDSYSIDTVITFAACLGARKKDMEDEGRLHKYIEDIYKTIVLVISS